MISCPYSSQLTALSSRTSSSHRVVQAFPCSSGALRRAPWKTKQASHPSTSKKTISQASGKISICSQECNISRRLRKVLHHCPRRCWPVSDTLEYTDMFFQPAATASARTGPQLAVSSPPARSYSTQTDARQGSEAFAYDITPDEARQLVDVYPVQGSHFPGSTRWPLNMHYQSTSKRNEILRDEDLPKTRHVQSAGIYTASTPTMGPLARCLKEKQATNDDIFSLYMQLPVPRMNHISGSQRRALMKRLGVVPLRDESALSRFMTAFNDILAAGLKPERPEWTGAIYLTGRSYPFTPNKLQQTLDLWRRMESEGQTPADAWTFNILFDCAAKAGKFVLASMLHTEMQHRGLAVDRFFRTSWIYYQGLRRSGQGVREAYEDFVNSGEIVDSAVITCVITSLINCGEPASAEQIFERMKQLHADKVNAQMPPSSWRGKKDMGKLLRQAALMGDVEKTAIAKAAPIAPSEQTYRALIHHHIHIGNIDRAEALRREMGRYGLAIPGRVWFDYFRGFQEHGASPYSSWTEKTLEKTFKSFVESLDAEGSTNFLSASTVKLCVQAFMTCADIDRAREVFDTLLERWTPQEEELKEIEEIFAGARENNDKL